MNSCGNSSELLREGLGGLDQQFCRLCLGLGREGYLTVLTFTKEEVGEKVRDAAIKLLLKEEGERKQQEQLLALSLSKTHT